MTQGEMVHHEEYEHPGPGWIIVPTGREAAEKVLDRRPIKITSEIGSQTEVGGSTVIVQFSQEYAVKIAGFKGGKWEKQRTLWMDVWEDVGRAVMGTSTKKPEVYPLSDPKDIIEVIEYARDNVGLFGYDYETWGDVSALRPELCTDFRIVSVGLAFRVADGPSESSGGNGKPGCIRAFSWLFDRPGRASTILESVWLSLLNTGKGTAHNSRYEHQCNIRRFGHTYPTRCTMLRMRAINELAAGSLERVMARCGLYWPGFKEENNETRIDPMNAEVGDLLRYGALDAYACLHCDEVLSEAIDHEELNDPTTQDELFSEYLARQESDGFHVDLGAVAEQTDRLTGEETQLLKALHKDPAVDATREWAGPGGGVKTYKGEKRPFNPDSAPIMKHLVLDELGIRPEMKTKGGAPSVNKDSLAEYVNDYPVLAKMTEYRSATSMKTFLGMWSSFMCTEDCVHSQFRQDIVVTGRLSSSHPPLQNIPKKSEIRRVFTSRYPGGVLISSDYAQQEPRLVAGWSGDVKMLQVLEEGRDMHAYAAHVIYGVPYEGADTAKRDVGKRMNLGIIYGQTYHGLAEKTGISKEEARTVIDEYNRQFNGLARWMEMKKEQARTLGYVTDLFGARRHLEDARSGAYHKKQRALRQAGNFPIQGTAYRFTQIAVVRLMQIIEEKGLKATVCGQVHDSIIVDVHPKDLESILDAIEEAMLIHNELYYWKNRGAPMKIDVSVGHNLYDMESVVRVDGQWTAA